MKVLNLYAGLGGNRKLWEGCDVTAVEYDQRIADQYAANYPSDKVIVGDAHDYLAEHFDEYEFIWSSPPCQTHSRAAAKGHNQTPRYPAMELYQEILFLQAHAKGKWVVENVVPYYKPLIPAQRVGRHLFWANFHIDSEDEAVPLFATGRRELQEWLGVGYEGNIYYGDNHDPCQVLRNCVHPSLGLDVFNSAKGLESCSATQASLSFG